MTATTLFPTLQCAEPFRAAPPKGQAVAVAILLACAVAGVAWAGCWPATTPEAPAVRAPAVPVTSDQLQAASLRIRYADVAVVGETSAALGGAA